MSHRALIAIEIGRSRLRAVLASREGDRLVIRRTLVEAIPAGVRGEAPEVLGRHIGEVLQARGFGRGRVTVALAREFVGVKRIVLPTRDPSELPGMTRLALKRELPFDPEHALVDYVPVATSDVSTTVLAVAAPARVRENTAALMEAAGLTIERIGLRAMGAAALLRGGGAPEGECGLVVDLTGDGVEFAIVEDGAVRFSRAAEPIEGASADEVVERLITETRRTWMSYRIVEGASDVSAVTMLGSAEIADVAAPLIGDMLHADARVLREHPRIDAGVEDLAHVWPLVGLLLEPILGGEMIDFAHPRRAPDRRKGRRRRALIGAGAVAIAILGAWTLANRDLRSLESDLDLLRTRRQKLEATVARYGRDNARLAHLEQWEAADVDWLDHLRWLDEVLPPPGELVLDGWSGSLDFRGVRYDRREKQWSASKVVTIVLEGEAKDRATADALRSALVESAWYETASSGVDTMRGRRLPWGFTYRLRTEQGEIETTETGADGSDEGDDTRGEERAQ